MKKAFLLPVLCCLVLSVQAAGFSDVPEDYWAAEPIAQAVDAGAVSGYIEGDFRPGEPVTAAHFCAMLSRTFLSERLKETGAEDPWWLSAVNACADLLGGTAAGEEYIRLNQWGDAVHQPLRRYDLALMLWRLLPEETGEAGPADIADWADIPDAYRSAVSACWAAGLLQGQADGRFRGEEALNRAQACAVWSRLQKLLPDSVSTGTEDPTPALEMPAFHLEEDETVQEMMLRVNGGTPPCQEGCLPNGKPNTEENIQALLELVKEGCPDGTVWSSTERFWYQSPKLGGGRGCRSFGAAVSDFLFGEEAPVRESRYYRDLKVGDVVYVQAGGGERVAILTSIDWEDNTFTSCELTSDGKISWSGWGLLSGFINSVPTTIYSRW